MDTPKLAELYDREVIRGVLLRQCQYLDAFRFDLMAEVWAEDCRTDFGPARGGVVEGRDAFLERIAGSREVFDWTFHLLGDSTFDIEGDRAIVTTPVLAWHQLVSGQRSWVAATYHDELRREEDRWLIWSRKTVVSGVDGPMAEQAWHWLRRGVPSPKAKTPGAAAVNRG
jgi:hypothetical protein